MAKNDTVTTPEEATAPATAAAAPKEPLLAVEDFAASIPYPESSRAFVKIMRAANTTHKTASDWADEYARFMAA